MSSPDRATGAAWDLEVRALRPDDLDRVEELEPQLFGAGAWSRRTFADEIDREDRVYLAVDLDGGLVAYGGVALDPEWNVMTIGVAPQARRRGVATALLAALIGAAREARGTELFLEVRAHDGGAQQLYLNAGFTRVGLRRRYYQPEGADAVVMRLNLRAPGAGPMGAASGDSSEAVVSGEESTVAPFVDVTEAHREIWSARPPVVLDVRWSLGETDGRRDYAVGHLPGAVYVDLDRELAGPPSRRHGRHPLPDLAALQESARSWGITNGARVLIYDDWGGKAAARAWWLLRWAGVRDVAIIDGGLRGWVEAGHHLEDGFVRPRPGDVALVAGNLETVDIDDVATFPDRGGILVDARAGERYRGETEPIDPRTGHIPGAVNVPTQLNAPEGWLLETDELRQRYAAVGVARVGPPVAVYCGSGVTAAHTVAVLTALGIQAALYPGSYSQWSNDPEREVALGPEGKATA